VTAAAPVAYPPLGAAITARREEIGMTRPLLAQLAGIPDHIQVLHIERGNVTVASRTLAHIAAALRTEPWLIERRAWDIYRQQAAAGTETAS
jgi:transcriptional regulator with XRE-family HTH domain